MGQAAGKLVISHPNTKSKGTAENLDANGTDTQAENTPQIVNGIATDDVPPIDEDIETDKENDKTEAHLNGASGHTEEAATGPDGKVSGVEGETTEEERRDSKTPKKTKNPITWIQRRLSKRNSTTKKQSVDETPAEGDTEHVDEHPVEDAASHPVEVSESEVKQVAEALVDEAISSAVTSGNEQQVHQPEVENAPHVAETPEPKLSDASDHQPRTEVIDGKHETAAEIENNVPEVAADIPTNDTTEANGYPVVDTNNTNVENGCCQEKIVTLKEQDEVSKKLANLEIANGHMENEEVLMNGDSTA